MGSTKWNNKRGVQCPECDAWMDADSPEKTPGHKPKGDVLSIKDCSGSGRKPRRVKGFEPKSVYPYKERKGREGRKGK